MTRHIIAVAAGAILATSGWRVFAQATVEPVNDRPNPYAVVENFFKLPAGREWGATSAIDIDKDGTSIWVAERCGGNSSCVSNPVDPILKFDANGNLVRSFGRGAIVSPHGIHVDRDGNVWVTDYQDDSGNGGRSPLSGAAAAARGRGDGAGRGAAADGAGRGGRGAAPLPIPRPGATRGHQVHKFSPEGKPLMSIGHPGGADAPDCCWQPNDVITNEKGEIFIAMVHGAGGRIMKLTPQGLPIKTWGEPGSGPGQFSTPHSLAFDSKGRLFVADRGNVRIQIFDQEGKFLEEWKQFSRISGLYITPDDTLYAADSESSATSNPGWLRGIRIGSARDGRVTAFIPDPQGPEAAKGGTSAAEGVAVDRAGNVYGAEVGPTDVKRYVKK
jgi:sugar lactone lactonase YvrE